MINGWYSAFGNYLPGREILATFWTLMRYITIFSIVFFSSFYAIGQSADTTAIQQVMADFISAWNVHDPKAFSMVFAEDADFTNIKGLGAHGRLNIDSFHAPFFRTCSKNSFQKI